MNYPTSSFPCFEIKKESANSKTFSVIHYSIFIKNIYIPWEIEDHNFFIREKYFEDMTAISQL